jgi:hypothetical protein
MAERCGNCLAPLMPDTCTHQFTCLYCEVEKIELRERIGSDPPVTQKTEVEQKDDRATQDDEADAL